MANDLLCIEDLHAWYGAAHVLHGIELQVQSGEIVSLLGRNGAGRSTTARAIMGLVECRGRINWRGRNLCGLPTFEIARLGLGFVPESRDIFPGMTVAQNLLLGQKASAQGRWRIDDMYRMFPVLAQRAQVPAHVLSGGEQQMLALCRTLMGEPDLIVVDEPMEGLAPMIVAQVAAFLKELKQQGVSILLIEQRLDVALAISDQVAVLGHGKIVFKGTPAALRADEQTRREWIEL